jgi:PAS domain S-box-containing protein
MDSSQALAGSLLMGGGIASMHYIGMAAMRLSATTHYDSFLVVLSVVFAVLISLAALWITFHFRDEKTGIGWRKIAGSVVMGAAIPIMHYTAMAAASFRPSRILPDLSRAVSISTLGTVGIVTATLIVLGLALLTSWLDRRFAAQALERQEEKLQQSEAYLSEAQRLSHTGSFGWRISSGEISWSEETFRIFEYDPTTKPTVALILQRVHPEDTALVRETIQCASQDGKDFDFEHRLLMPDGAVKHLHIVAHAERDKSGELEFIGAVMDVTVAKEAREKLRRSEEKYRDLMNASPDAVCVVDANGILAMVNPAGIKLSGRPKEDFVGSSLAETYLPEERDLLEQRIERLKREGSLRFERKFVRKNGEIIPVEVSLSGLRGGYYQAIIRDISERKRSEEALRASEQVARGQVEAMTYSLDVLATAPAPDQFLGQMLSTIGRLLDAQSVILWLLDEANDSLDFRAVAQGSKLATADPEHPFVKDLSAWKTDKLMREAIFTGAPVICDDVEHDPRVSSAIREYFASKGTKKHLTIPTLVAGHVRGFIGIRHDARPPYRPEEIELAQALAHQAMLAIQLTDLAEQGRKAAVLGERNRMARDIHDTLAQGFTGVIVQLEAVSDAISSGDHNEAERYLRRASELARQSLNEARRSVHALRPEALRRANFWEALKGIIKNTTAGNAICTKTRLRGKLPELPPLWEENLMHIGQEALTNALKYAHADIFETQLICNAKELRLEFQDDGDGFNVEDRHDGFGLSGMRERIQDMGGELEITSARGKGTKITVLLPTNGESTS